MEKIKFDLNDISLVPETLSMISSRSEVNALKNGKLPLMCAPMDTTISLENYQLFDSLGFTVCMPRNRYALDNNVYNSYGIDEVELMVKGEIDVPAKVLLDTANAHSIRVYEVIKKFKETYPDIKFIVGNIANPLTYEKYAEIGVDGVRAGIGNGSACTTSSNTSVHFPMGSLISECYQIKVKNNFTTEIIADGGFRTFADIIKALALGADQVMIGGIISKSLQSCSTTYIKEHGNYIELSQDMANILFLEGKEIYKRYRGMSTKEVQKDWGKKTLKTAEGISFYNKVEYSIEKWVENFSDYLKSAMSYCNAKDLDNFVGKAEYAFITEQSFKRFNK